MQTDPIGYGSGLNWYNYVNSDPINRIDPTGLIGDKPCATNDASTCPPPEDINADANVIIVYGRRYRPNLPSVGTLGFDGSNGRYSGSSYEFAAGENDNVAEKNSSDRTAYCSNKIVAKYRATTVYDSVGIISGIVGIAAPGAGTAAALVGAVSGAGGIANSIANNSADGTGLGLGIGGLIVGGSDSLAKAVKIGGGIARALPGLGLTISVYSALSDLGMAIAEYKNCIMGRGN